MIASFLKGCLVYGSVKEDEDEYVKINKRGCINKQINEYINK